MYLKNITLLTLWYRQTGLSLMFWEKTLFLEMKNIYFIRISKTKKNRCILLYAYIHSILIQGTRNRRGGSKTRNSPLHFTVAQTRNWKEHSMFIYLILHHSFSSKYYILTHLALYSPIKPWLWLFSWIRFLFSAIQNSKGT